MIFDVYTNGLSDAEKSAMHYEYGIHYSDKGLAWINFHFISDLRYFCDKYNMKFFYNPYCAAGEIYRLPNEKEEIDHQKG